MAQSPQYEAAWVPGLDHEIDQDQSLLAGFAWLTEAERRHGGVGIIVMNAKLMMGNAPLLAEASRRWDFVSPRSRRPHGQGPVLAIYPADDRVLGFAESLAFGTALCVIPGTLYDVSAWIRRTGARCLVAGFAPGAQPSLPPEITKSLDSMVFFGGHNGFLGGGEKEDAIRRLREIARRPDAPSRDAIEEYLRTSGDTKPSGIERACTWYAEILEGKRHRDYRGQIID